MNEFLAEAEQLAEEWPLWQQFHFHDDPLIVVVGAYKGKLMQMLLEKFPEAEVVGYEPQLWAYKIAIERLEPYKDRCVINGYGMGIQDMYNQPMGEFGTDACSFVNVGPQAREHGVGSMKDASDCMKFLALPIDLMIINIEGYEYYLVPYLISHNHMVDVDRLAVQFHHDLGEGLTPELTDHVIKMVSSTGLKIVEDDRPTWVYWER